MGDNLPPFRNILVENPVNPEVVVNNIVQLDGNVSLCDSNNETESKLIVTMDNQTIKEMIEFLLQLICQLLQPTIVDQSSRNLGM